MDSPEEREVAEFRNSGKFDEAWYVAEYPDVKLAGMDPARHYLWLGARLGRRASPEAEGGAVTVATSPSPPSEVRAQGQSRTQKANGIRSAIQKIHGIVDGRKVLRELTPELRSKISELHLFDESYYRSQSEGLILNEDDLLADYIGAFDNDLNRDPGLLFSTKHYLDIHPDVRDMHPLIHYVQYGLEEGRAAFCPRKVNEFLASAADVALESLFDILPNDRPINVLYWEDGNFFLTDVARFVGQLLNEQGYEAVIRTQLPVDGPENALNVVVAPHEFCAVGPGRHWTAEQYADAVYINTEQWQTSWFSLSLRYLKLTSRGVLDLNPSSAQGLAKMGMRSAFLPLLPLKGSCFDFSGIKSLSDHVTRLKFIEPLSCASDFEGRPYDIVCCAILNDRRAKVLARLAPILAGQCCFIHMPRFNRPIKPGEPDVLTAGDFAHVARNSKIMLNIHQGETHYLEWQRAFLIGMMQGTVVVSEPCYSNKFVQPDIHYIEAPIESMGAVLSNLLSTQEGSEKLSRIHRNVVTLRERILAGERFLS